ncbi:MAG: sigma-70 family RNA polymerase sigma factor [Pirellulaceae bacterium]|nr:sigma-70 family RNA polymerase sigma factor [Pirellulaceae bacterium]
MSESMPDQPEVLEQLRRDGQQGLAVHFQQLRARLARIVAFRLDRRLSGRVSESDVLQEAYVRAAKRLENYLSQPDPPPLFVWLRMELQQQLIDTHRAHLVTEKRDVRREIGLFGFADPNGTSRAMAFELSAQMTSPSQLLRRAEQLAWLETALNQMNDLDREVIALRHFEELSNDETAQVLQISPDAASKRYLRALKRLKEISAASNPADSVQ